MTAEERIENVIKKVEELENQRIIKRNTSMENLDNENNPYMFEKTDKTINDYPEKKLILADLIRVLDDKTHVCIIDNEIGEVIYNNRVEYIKWTSEGCCSSLCDKPVKNIDSSMDNNSHLCIEVNLDMRNKKENELDEFISNLLEIDSNGLRVYSVISRLVSIDGSKYEIDLLELTSPSTPSIHHYTEIIDKEILFKKSSEEYNKLAKFLDKRIMMFSIKSKYMKVDYDEALQEVFHIEIVLAM